MTRSLPLPVLTISQLLFTLAVYAYMNAVIFKLLGVVILIFDVFLAIIFALGINKVVKNSREFTEASSLYFGFLLLSTLIAVGLIRLHRWAAVTASVIGVIWALALASALGQSHHTWRSILVGWPVTIGMLVPLYATVRNWSSLKPLENLSSFRALRSLDRFHLE